VRSIHQRALDRGEAHKVFRITPPHAFRMAADNAERRAWRIEQHGVERLCGTPGTAIGFDDRHRELLAGDGPPLLILVLLEHCKHDVRRSLREHPLREGR
jgi:hypothetical protein